MTTERRSFEYIESGMIWQDYNAQAPRHAGAAAIDEDICRHSTCPECEQFGLEYHPFIKPGSYRAFAVCPVCGYWEEF